MLENNELKNKAINNEDNGLEGEDLNEILRVRRAKLSELQKNSRDPFKIVKYEVTHSTSYIVDNFEEMEGKDVSIAGRMMSKGMGKASFAMCKTETARFRFM